MPPRLNVLRSAHSILGYSVSTSIVANPAVLRCRASLLPILGVSTEKFQKRRHYISAGGSGSVDRVEEILKRDRESRDKAPSFAGLGQNGAIAEQKFDLNPLPLSEQPPSLERPQAKTVDVFVGHNFPLPELPLPSNAHLRHRYDPVVQLVTNLLMRHGKLSAAQRNMSFILQYLRTSPPPITNPNRPLLPSAPPPSHLPLNPTLYLTLAIDSVAPLLRIRSQRGAAGGGAALQIPVPLGLRQRRKRAVQWILDAASRRRSKGSGKGGFAQRVAEEVVAVVEGRSNVWEKRGSLHKLGVGARAHLNFGRRR